MELLKKQTKTKLYQVYLRWKIFGFFKIYWKIGIIVSTKNDLKNLRQVEMVDAVDAGKKLGLDYFETAAVMIQ